MTISIEITRTRIVETNCTTEAEALEAVKSMYESGDACAELEDATYKVTPVLCIIPANMDETATAWDEGITYDPSITGWTPDLIRELFEQVDEEVPDDFSDMNMDDMLECLQEQVGIYGVTHFLCVDKRHIPKIEEWSKWALENGGDDSSWYNNCKDFHDKVHAISEKVIDLSTGKATFPQLDKCSKAEGIIEIQEERDNVVVVYGTKINSWSMQDDEYLDERVQDDMTEELSDLTNDDSILTHDGRLIEEEFRADMVAQIGVIVRNYCGDVNVSIDYDRISS
jgi:hypothetical protein